MRPSIAVFQAEWPLQSQTFNCVFMLGQAGYPVDLFLFEAPIYHELDGLCTIPRVRVHTFSRTDNMSQFSPRRIWIFVRDHIKSRPYLGAPLMRIASIAHDLLESVRELYALVKGKEDGLLPEWLLHKTQSVMEGKDYTCFIGVEKKGLIWAGLIGERLGIPYIYYSLELYTRNHPESRRSLHTRRTKLVEEQYHKKSVSTIIQDPERAEILLRDNGVRSCDLFYVPVSLLGRPYRDRSSLLRERFRFSEDQTLILQFGQICEERLSIELARTAQGFPEDWALVLHGYGPDSAVRSIQEIDIRNRVFLSLEKVPAHQIRELIASADIGLALYSPSSMNDLLTAFSSEKVALYLQCGLPLIAFDYPGYRRLFDRYRCGVMISTLEELPEAVDTIRSSYEEFRSNAYECFMECYEFSKPFQKVIMGIGDLRKPSSSTLTSMAATGYVPRIRGRRFGRR